MKIALIVPPLWTVLGPPIGVSFIAKALREANHQVLVYDYNILTLRELYPDLSEIWHLSTYRSWSEKELYEKDIKDKVERSLIKRLDEDILNHHFDAIGFSVYNCSLISTSHMMSYLREKDPSLKLFMGGMGVIVENIRYFFDENLIDAAVFGEGERIATELIEAWENNRDISLIPGLLLNSNMKTPNGNRESLKADEIPIPDYDDFDLELYATNSLPIQTSRGCVGGCYFCNEKQKFRSRSARHIFNELISHNEKYGTKDFEFIDSLVNGNPKILLELAQLIIDSKLCIHWGGNARIAKNLTYENLLLLKRSGCVFFSFGLESGSSTVLKLMNKGFDRELASFAIKNTSKAGIAMSVNILIGFPGENDKEFKETLSFLKEHKDYITEVNTGSTLGIGIGSYLFNNPQKFNIKTNNGKIVFDGYSGWSTEDGTNTIKIRMKRLSDLQLFLEKNDIKFNKVV